MTAWADAILGIPPASGQRDTRGRQRRAVQTRAAAGPDTGSRSCSQLRSNVLGTIGAVLVMIPVLVHAQERVVSTDAAITEIVSALGAADRLVGIDVTSEVPAGLDGLPRVGYHRALSAEGLLSLAPDLVLASEHAGPASVIARLRATGIDVVSLPVPLSTDGLINNIDRISQVLGRDAEGLKLAGELREKRGALQRRQLAGYSALLLRESDAGLRVAGTGTAGDALLRLLGSDNAADFAGYRSFSQEALLSVNPQLMVIATDAPFVLDNFLRRYPLLRHSAAAGGERLLSVPGAALVGGLSIAVLDEAEALLEQLTAQQLALP